MDLGRFSTIVIFHPSLQIINIIHTLRFVCRIMIDCLTYVITISDNIQKVLSLVQFQFSENNDNIRPGKTFKRKFWHILLPIKVNKGREG